MKQLYRRTLEHVHMPQERYNALRETLISRCASNRSEVRSMNHSRTLRRPAVLAIALLALLALTATAFAAGTYVTYRLNSSADIPAGDSIDLLEMAPDAALPYEGFIEEGGDVTVTFGPGDWAQTN